MKKADLKVGLVLGLGLGSWNCGIQSPIGDCKSDPVFTIIILLITVYSHLRKYELAGMYSHFLVLLTAKTVLTYIQSLQAVSQRYGLAQVVQ